MKTAKWENNLPDLFESPISATKVRNNVTAYRYRNGVINIAGAKYQFYPIKEAIRLWRHNNPINN